ncbi:MAG: hypothetical protein WEB06_11080 [Actinomycetota bacterium]
MNRTSAGVAALVVALLLAPTASLSAPDGPANRALLPACSGQLAPSSTTEVASCTFRLAHRQLSIEGFVGAGGVTFHYILPFAPTADLTVAVLGPSGENLLSCTSFQFFVTTCTRAGLAGVRPGSTLTCVARAWTNVRYGIARGGFGCASW